MIEISPGDVTPAIRALFATDGSTFRRCFAVLDGKSGGRILTDDPAAPAWGAVHELSSDGALFLGGSLTGTLVGGIIAELRRERRLTVGLKRDDPLNALMPPNPSSEGILIDFDDRDPGVILDVLVDPPTDLRLERIDGALEPRCIWAPWMSADGRAAFEHGLGYCLLHGEEVVSEAFAGPEVDGVLEMAVITREGYRGRGLARIVCARTILECERLGYRTWWNTSLGNVASAGLARSLGYRTERRYRTLVWDRAT